MKTIKIISIVFIIIHLQSCCSDKNSKTSQVNNTKNDLLFDEVIIHDNFAIIDDESKPEWMENFGLKTEFLQIIIDSVKSGNFQFYEPSNIWDKFEEMDPAYFKTSSVKFVEDFVVIMDVNTGKLDTVFFKYDVDLKVSNIEEIQFIEKWFFNAEDFYMSKKVISYTPFKNIKDKPPLYYFKIKADYNTNPFYDWASTLNKASKNPDYISLGKNIKNWNGYNEAQGLDEKKFINIIIDKIIKGDVQIYDPVYLVDLTKSIITLEELEQNIGCSLSSIRDQIILIYDEDWYFNTKNLKIKKSVNGVSLIRNRYDTESQSHKLKSLCYIEFNKP